MSTDRQATTVWEGDLEAGSGQTSLDTSGAAGPFTVSWPRRAGDANGQTSPEELLAAAHASCYSMFLSGVLSKQGHVPERLETSATATFTVGQGVTNVALFVRGTVPGISESDFLKAAETAKDGCPISQVIAGNTTVTLDAALA